MLRVLRTRFISSPNARLKLRSLVRCTPALLPHNRNAIRVNCLPTTCANRRFVWPPRLQRRNFAEQQPATTNADKSQSQTFDSISNYTFTLALACVPPVVLASSFGASWTAFLAGGVAWAGAVVAKPALYRHVQRLLRFTPTTHHAVVSAALGFTSGVAELVPAAFIFLTRHLLDGAVPLPEVVMFGVGASSFEIGYVLYQVAREIWKAIANKHNAQTQTVDAAQPQQTGEAHNRPRWTNYAVSIERLLTGVSHVTSRMLVLFAAVNILPGSPAHLSRALLAAAVAFGGFAVVDGMALFGQLRRWNWADPAPLRRMYATVFVMMLAELGLVIYLCSERQQRLRDE